MIIAFVDELRDGEPSEVILKQRIEKIVGYLDIRGPRGGFSGDAKGVFEFIDAGHHGIGATLGLGQTEEIVGLSCAGDAKKNIPRGDIVFQLTPTPHELQERSAGLQIGGQAVEQDNANEIGLGFAQTEEGITGHLRDIVLHVIDGRLCQAVGGTVTELVGERRQNGEIGGAFEVKHPTTIFGVIILVKADAAQRL